MINDNDYIIYKIRLPYHIITYSFNLINFNIYIKKLKCIKYINIIYKL